LNSRFDIVTGGCGFIGSHLVDALLAKGREVSVIDNLAVGRRANLFHHEKNSRLRIIEADISNGKLMKDEFVGADRVFHLAAMADIVPSIKDPSIYFETNVRGTFSVLEAARAANVQRFIYAASSSCYGIPDIYPTPETCPVSPRYPYALTKWLGEQQVLHWTQVYKLPAISLRLFNVYGPRGRTTGSYGAMFGVFLAQLLASKPLTVVGDGEQTRDFTYVSDVVDAMMIAAESKTVGGPYNVGSGSTVSINRIVKLLGSPNIVSIPKRPGEPNCTHADISMIQRDLRWKPKVSIENGVTMMLDQLSDWQDAPLWNETDISAATADWFKYLGSNSMEEIR